MTTSLSFEDKVITKIQAINQKGLSNITVIKKPTNIVGFDISFTIETTVNIKELCSNISKEIGILNQKLYKENIDVLVDIYADLLAHFAVFKEVFILYAFKQLKERETLINKYISDFNKILGNEENVNVTKSTIVLLNNLKDKLQIVQKAKEDLTKKDVTLQEILKVTAGILDDTTVKSIGQLNSTSNP